jgi:hypothetical protein
MNEIKKRGRPKKIVEQIKEEPKEKQPAGIEDNEEMNDKQMENILAELVDTNFWTAIKRLSYRQYESTRDSLITIDPVTNPALIARNQGVISGLIYLESYVYKIINDRKMERDEKEGKINLPNYNS